MHPKNRPISNYWSMDSQVPKQHAPHYYSRNAFWNFRFQQRPALSHGSLVVVSKVCTLHANFRSHSNRTLYSAYDLCRSEHSRLSSQTSRQPVCCRCSRGGTSSRAVRSNSGFNLRRIKCAICAGVNLARRALARGVVNLARFSKGLFILMMI
jgi:hypothetical protein